MHPSEGDLLALIDGELEPKEAGAVRSHLAECAECAGRKAELEVLLADNRGALDSLDAGDPPATTADHVMAIARLREPLPSRRPTRYYLKAASITLLIGSAALAVAMPGSPIREVALDLIDDFREGEPEIQEDALRTGVALEPTGRLVVSFAERQDRGTIEVVLASTSRAQVDASEEGASFSVASNSIAVGNAGAAASYVVTVPERLADVDIRVGDRTVFRKTGEEVVSVPPASEGRYLIPFASID